SARPREIQRLEFPAEFQDPGLPDRKCVVVKEYFVYIRKQLERMFDFGCYILRRSCPPGVAVKGLGPQAKGAERWTPSSRVKRYVWMQEKRYVIAWNVEVALIYGSHPG